jgi:ethanolamine utilization protein EutA
LRRVCPIEELCYEGLSRSLSLDQLALKSIGIDIGSTTSHFVVSRLILQPVSTEPEAKLEVKKRDILFESEIIFTPFKGIDQIDGEALNRFIRAGYSKISIKPKDVDVGAIIVTGVAARKENAERVASSISDLAGDFVCVTAGPRLEAILSAFGSGAVSLSLGRPTNEPGHEHAHNGHIHTHTDERNDHDDGHSHNPLTIMNVDIGGGTTKIALAWHGRILETIAINVGSRLIKWDEQGLLTGVEPAARIIAKNNDTSLQTGQKVDLAIREQLANSLVDCLFELILFLSGHKKQLSDLTRDLLITKLPNALDDLDLVVFSGGVSEYIYGLNQIERGDMGVTMGKLILERVQNGDFPLKVGRPSQFIRATVIGASHYTCQISGNTIFVSNEKALPIKNALMIPVQMPDQLQYVEPQIIARKFQEALEAYDEQERWLAFYVNSTMLGHDGIRALTKGLLIAIENRLARGLPLILVFSANVGRQVGLALKEYHKVKNIIVCVDEIQPENMAYIDIGLPLNPSGPVPVVVKSLIFDDSSISMTQKR